MEDHQDSRIFLASVAAFSIPFAFFVGPLIRFMPAQDVALAGLAIGIGAAMTWSSTQQGWGKRWTLPGWIIGVGGGVLLTHMFNVARETAAANDRRCLAIQRDMLSSAPRRPDGADLFQALACRPQGAGSVYATRKSNV